jgi:hypothetical protein
VEGVSTIESSSGTRQNDHLGGLLFVLAHYQALFKTMTQTPNRVFTSLTDDTHIMGPMNELSYPFDHLLTQLTQVGLKVKVSKCKFWGLS